MSEGKYMHASTFQVSAYILSAHIPLAEVRYVAQICINGLEKDMRPTVGEGEWIVTE